MAVSSDSYGLISVQNSWFDGHTIPVLDWPANLSELNPVEGAWAKLETMIYRLDPNSELLTVGLKNKSLILAILASERGRD